MPGEVSRSYPGPKDPPIPPIKEQWQAELNEEGSRYFVLHISDMFAALGERDVKTLDRLLVRYNAYRMGIGKPPSRYYVAKRSWKCGPQVKALIENEFGIQIKE